LVGPHDHPRLTLDSIPLAAWMPAFDAGDMAGVAMIMLESTRVLAAAGAQFAICPDNSAHLAWPHLRDETPIPWLHIVEVVGAEARARNFGRVGVLGTRFTMGSSLYADVLSPMGIETLVPEDDDLDTVDDVIFRELVNGIVSDESRAAYVEVIGRLGDRGCDAVALACTEIPLLVSPDDSPLPVLDSTRLLARAALRHAIS
jgi:aspartate racemase